MQYLAAQIENIKKEGETGHQYLEMYPAVHAVLDLGTRL